MEEKKMNTPSENEEAEGQDDFDSVKLYLKEIGKESLLSKEEEVELAKRKDDGDAEARDRLITTNLRLVVSEAKKYSKYGVPLADLIQEGSIGLTDAVDKFDYTRGNRLSTFATHYIKKEIIEALKNSGLVVLPPSTSLQLRKVKKSTQKLLEELGREPTIEELSKDTGIRPSRIKELQAIPAEVSSLDELIYEDSTSTRGDLVSSEDDFDSEKEHLIEQLKELFENICTDKNVKYPLTRLEVRILTLYFGIDNPQKYLLEKTEPEQDTSRECIRPLSIEEIGRELDIPREHIRQRLDQIFHKIYLHPKKEKLQDILCQLLT